MLSELMRAGFARGVRCVTDRELAIPVVVPKMVMNPCALIAPTADTGHKAYLRAWQHQRPRGALPTQAAQCSTGKMLLEVRHVQDFLTNLRRAPVTYGRRRGCTCAELVPDGYEQEFAALGLCVASSARR